MANTSLLTVLTAIVILNTVSCDSFTSTTEIQADEDLGSFLPSSQPLPNGQTASSIANPRTEKVMPPSITLLSGSLVSNSSALFPNSSTVPPSTSFISGSSIELSKFSTSPFNNSSTFITSKNSNLNTFPPSGVASITGAISTRIPSRDGDIQSGVAKVNTSNSLLNSSTHISGYSIGVTVSIPRGGLSSFETTVATPISTGPRSTSSPTKASTSEGHWFCIPYENPQEDLSYCTCDDNKSYTMGPSGKCSSTPPPISEAIPPPTTTAPSTPSNGFPYTKTDIISGIIWGCEISSVVHDIGPVPFTECAGSSSSVGMAFTPTTEPTLKPSPTEDVKCYPTHGTSDEEKVILLAQIDYDTLCHGKSSRWTTVGADTGDPASPVANNGYDSTFTKADNAPSRCNQLYTGSGIPKDVLEACIDPLNAITKACPWNGGEVRNECGKWTLQSCSFGIAKCSVGDPH